MTGLTLCSFISSLSDMINGVAEAKQQMWQHVNDVGLEQAAQHVAQHLKGEQGTLAVVRVLLVSHGICQLLHDVHLLQRQDAQAFDNTGDS